METLTSASVYSWDFDILNYEIFINEFQYSVVSLFIEGGAGLYYLWFVLVVALNNEYNFIIAKLTVWVWCSYNERTNRLRANRSLLTNCLHGKAAELCLANS